MKILLVGASGCFGTEFRKIVSKNKKIKLFCPPSKKINLIDFEKVKKYIIKKNPNLVLNAASIVGINQCEENFFDAYELNSVSVLNLAKICKNNKITMVQTSTHAVFDGKKKSSYTEKDIPISNNVYSSSKLAAEHFVRSMCPKYYIFRFPTMYGDRNNKLFGFVDKVIMNLKKNNKMLIAHDKIDSPSYAKDVAKEVLNVILSKKYGIYHINNSGVSNYYNFVIYLKKLMFSKSKIIPVKDNYFKSTAEKPLRNSIKSYKLKSLRHWKIALKEYISYLK